MIVIYPELEPWIIAVANKMDINLDDYGLNETPHKFKKMIHTDLKKSSV